MKSSRRQFITRTACAAGSLMILPSARTVRAAAANERLNIAVFGTMYNAEHFLTAIHTHNAAIVALCNPDQRKIPGVLKKWEETANRFENSDRPEQRRAAEQYRRMARRDGVKIRFIRTSGACSRRSRTRSTRWSCRITIIFMASLAARRCGPANLCAANARSV
jgi:hypothetical protein